MKYNNYWTCIWEDSLFLIPDAVTSSTTESIVTTSSLSSSSDAPPPLSSTVVGEVLGNNGTESSSPREKGGRCPNPGMDTRLCRDQVDQCTNDVDCGGNNLICQLRLRHTLVVPDKEVKINF